MTLQSILQLLGTLGIGIVIGNLLNHFLVSRRQRNQKLYDTRRKAYADFLVAFKSMRAQAATGQGIPKDMVQEMFSAMVVVELVGSEYVRKATEELLDIANVVAAKRGDPTTFLEIEGEIIQRMRSDLEELA